MVKRKFECWQCRHRFDADDESRVACPNCHSDNVDNAHFHLPKGTWKWTVSALVCAAVAWILLSMDWKCSENQMTTPKQPVIPEESVVIHDPIEESDSDTVSVDLGLKKPPTVNVKETPVYHDGSYSFDVIVENPPSAGSYYVVVLVHNDQHVVARSNDGHFDQVPPSAAEGGIYDFAVCAVANDSLLCEPMPRTGFLPQKSVAVRMTKEQLQELIDTDDNSLCGQGANDFIAPDCKLSFIGLPADVVNVPVNLEEVAEKKDIWKWSSISITNIEYDSMNRISAVTIEIKK